MPDHLPGTAQLTRPLAGARAGAARPAGRYRLGYWAAAFALLVLLAFSTVPSPLYGLYARRDGFSALTITVIYAAYALGVIASLVFAGHLSDTWGRRPLLLAGIGLAAVSAIVFLAWPSLPGLYVARIVCGLSVGVTSSTATAYLGELFAARRPARLAQRAQLTATAATLGGFGAGAGGAGLLAQYAGHPLTLPFAVWLAAFALAAAGLVLAPETRPRPDPLPGYRPQRISVPSGARPQFFSALLGIAVVLAVNGMFAGLAGTFLAVTLHDSSPALAGAAIFILFAVGVATAAATSTWPLRRLLGLAAALMVSGLALVVAAAWLPAPSLTLFLLGGAVVGAGTAAAFRGTLAVTVSISRPDKRAEALAGFFLAGYLGLSVPVIGLGVALQYASIQIVLLGFAAVITVAVLASTLVLLRSSPHDGH